MVFPPRGVYFTELLKNIVKNASKVACELTILLENVYVDITSFMPESIP